MDAPPFPFAWEQPRQRWFLLGLFVFFALVNVQYVLKIANADRDNRSAFLRWSGQIQKLETGADIWAEHAYPNPPIMALILWPFTELPPLAGSVAWFYAKVLMAVLSIGWVLSLLERGGRPFPFWGKALAVLLSLRPIAGDLVHGNVNLFILFLVTAALYAFGRRRDFAAGVLLGLAIACKVTPALFVPYFVWKRAWSTLLGTAAGLLLFVWLVPGAVLGFGDNERYLQSWWGHMVAPYVIDGKVTTEHQNQSLPGLLHRLLTASPSFSNYSEEDQGYVTLESHNVADLSPTTVRWLIKAAMAGFAVLVVWRCRTPTADRRDWRLLAEFSVVVLGMLLFSERTWKHHCVTLLLPFAVLAYALSARPVPRRTRWTLGTVIALASLLMLLTSTGLWDRHDRFGKLAQVYGAYGGAFVVLLGGMVILLGRAAPVFRTGAKRDALSDAADGG